MAKLVPVDIPSNIDYIKINKIRKSRGYSLEHGLVLEINALPGWQCRRLGGSSAGLPDLIAVNNQESKLLVYECKATKQAKTLYIPEKEVRRCFDIVDMFSIYDDRKVIVSFKFGRPYNKMYHFILPERCYNLMDKFVKLTCNVEGKCAFFYKATKFIYDPKYDDFKTGEQETVYTELEPFTLQSFNIGTDVNINTNPIIV